MTSTLHPQSRYSRCLLAVRTIRGLKQHERFYVRQAHLCPLHGGQTEKMMIISTTTVTMMIIAQSLQFCHHIFLASCVAPFLNLTASDRITSALSSKSSSFSCWRNIC
mmetsp:Transcript_31697/g.101211  ORF Transcript_31697/g.101211 Transcript_31697/m.101211 type:complete len:108 (+) Transcript_31697:165-488(+)